MPKVRRVGSMLAHLAMISSCGCLVGCASGTRHSPTSASNTGDSTTEASTLALVWTDHSNWVDVGVDHRTGSVYGVRGLAGHKSRPQRVMKHDADSGHGSAVSKVPWDVPPSYWTAQVCRVLPDGEVTDVAAIRGESNSPLTLHVCQLEPGGRSFLVTKPRRGGIVSALNFDGTALWTFDTSASITSLSLGDLDGDEKDEVVVSTSNAGLIALNADGQERWRKTDRTYIHEAAVIPAQAGNPGCVAVIGGLSFIDADGRSETKRNPSMSAGFVVGCRDADGVPRAILASSAPMELESMAANGKRHWHVVDDGEGTEKGGHMSDVALSPDGRWIAVSMKSANIFVLDARTGRRVARVLADMAVYPKVDWAVVAEGSPPRLLVSSPRGLACYELRVGEGRSAVFDEGSAVGSSVVRANIPE